MNLFDLAGSKHLQRSTTITVTLHYRTLRRTFVEILWDGSVWYQTSTTWEPCVPSEADYTRVIQVASVTAHPGYDRVIVDGINPDTYSRYYITLPGETVVQIEDNEREARQDRCAVKEANV